MLAPLIVSPSGEMILTGSFAGTVDFDPSAGTSNLTAVNTTDNFIAKYDANGNYVWAKNVGSAATKITGIDVDNSSNIIVSGSFIASAGATADFDPSASVANLTCLGSDIFVAKYNSSGSYLWATNIRVGVTPSATSYDLVKVTSSGDIVIGAEYLGSIDVDPSVGTTTINSGSTLGCFIAQYASASGALVWVTPIGGNTPNDLMIDKTGNILLTGESAGTADFDLTSAAGTINRGTYIAKYNTSGVYQWVIGIEAVLPDANGNKYARGWNLTCSDNAYYLTGSLMGTTDFDPTAATAYKSSTSSWDIFLAGYNLSGTYLWATTFGTTDVALPAAIDYKGGNLYMTGLFSGTADFDPSAGTVPVFTSNRMYLAKYALCTPAAGTPGAISGSTYLSPNTSGYVFSISPVSGATSYTWSVPPGFTIASGQGTNSITVNTGVYNGTIYVVADNGCAFSTPASLAVNVCPIAAAGPDKSVCDVITSLDAVAPFSGSGMWTLISGAASFTNSSSNTSTVTGLAAGNNVLRWTVTAGACPTSFDDVVVTRVLPPTTANAGPDRPIQCGAFVSLAGNTPTSGTGTWTLVSGNATISSPNSPTSQVTMITRTTHVFRWTITTAAPCSASSDDVSITRVNAPNCKEAATPFDDATEVEEAEKSIQVLPNPSENDFSLVVRSTISDVLDITVSDINGRVIQQDKANANEPYSFGANYRAGIYVVKIVDAGISKTIKVVKTK